MFHRLTAEQHKQVIDLYQSPDSDGIQRTMKEVAHLVHVSERTVYNVLKRYNIRSKGMGVRNRKLSDEQRAEIIHLYTTPQSDGTWLGTKTIARMFNVTDTTILYNLRRDGVAIRDSKEAHAHGKRCGPIKNHPQGDAPLCKCGCGIPTEWISKDNEWAVYAPGHYHKAMPYHDRDWLYEQYVIQKRRMSDIAAQFNVGPTTISRFIESLGIPSRTPRRTPVSQLDPRYKDRDWLHDQYVIQKHTVQEISDAIGVSPSAINASMHKLGIPIRSGSDAHTGKQSGSENPAWKGGVSKWKYAPGWKRIAKTIRKRDNYTCQMCGKVFQKSSIFLHVHHKDGDKLNNDPANLIAVCAACHPRGKRKEGWAQKRVMPDRQYVITRNGEILGIDPNVHVSTTAAAQVLGMTASNVIYRIKKGHVLGQKMGGFWYVDRASLEAFAKDYTRHMHITSR